MTYQKIEWQQFLNDYAVAKDEHQAAKEFAIRQTAVEEMTAAFLAEAETRDKLDSMRRRVCASIEASVRA